VVHTLEKRAKKFNEVSRMKESYWHTRCSSKAIRRHVDAMEAVGVSLIAPCLLDQGVSENGRNTGQATDAVKLDGRNIPIDAHFVRGADRRFDSYRNAVGHAFLNNRDEFPPSETIEVMSKRTKQWCVTHH
jgi:hypothetical protein